MAIPTKKGKAVRSKDIDLRDTYFEDAAERLWDRNKHDGYATIPKTLPMIMRAQDEMSKGKPLGMTYFALFCSTWDAWRGRPICPTRLALPVRGACADGRSA